MYLGAKHMVTGYDHVLFLVGVIFFLYRLKDIVLYVSLFTIGHSLTLLGRRARRHSRECVLRRRDDRVLGRVQGLREHGRLRARPGISAEHARRGVRLRARSMASASRPSCRSIRSLRNGLVTNIVSFNVGVEIGQMLALTAVLLALGYWRTRAGFLRHAYVTNAALMTAGFVLAGYQMTGYIMAAR